MDLGRFHRAIHQIADAYGTAGIPSLLDQLIGYLNTLSGNPADQSAADAYKAKLEELRQILYAFEAEVLVGAAAEVIPDLELEAYIGEGLFESIKEAMSGQLSPALAARALEKLKTELQSIIQHITTVNTAFTELNVEYEELGDGEAEIALNLPVDRDERTLSDLSQEAKDWNQIVATLSEVFDPERPQAKIRTLASGSWLIYLSSTPLVLWGIALTIRRVNQILSEAIQTKELIKQLTAVKAPTKEVEEHQQQKLTSELKDLASELVKQHYKGRDNGRKNELIGATSIALKQLTKKIAAGSRVNLRISDQEKPEIADENAPTKEEKELLAAAKAFEDVKNKADAEISQIEYFDDLSDVAALLPAPSEEADQDQN